MSSLILLLVALVVMYVLYRRSVLWKTVQISSGADADQLEAKYAFLKEHQVKCRVKSEGHANLGAMQAAASEHSYHTATLRLEVHSRDLGKAHQLLEQFEEEPFRLSL